MTDAIGFVPLQVIPSFRDMGRNLTSGFAPFVSAGRQAGEQAGQAAATGVAAARGAVEKASATLAKARDKEADAAGKIRVAEEKLAELRNRGITTGAQVAAAEERLATARRNSAAATRTAEQATSQLASAEERAANATDDVVRSGNGLAGAFSGLGGGVKQMAALAAAAGGAASAAALVGTAIEKEMGADKLAASLGASPALAAEYGAAASKAYAEGAGSSLGEVQNAVGLVQSSFATLGFEGDLNIDQAATAALSFADIFDTDITSSVQAASTLVSSGLADGSAQAFDLMTASFQKVPAAMRDELPEIIQEYGTNFRALGFSGEESFNLLVASAQQGKFALDKTGDALKEFTIRGTDMSKSSVGTYEAIGLNAEDMAARIAAGGDGAQTALQETAAGLLKIEDPAARANAAIALFGTPLEDLSVDQIPAFLEGLSGAEPAMAGFEGALGDASSTMYDNLGSKLEVMKRGFQETFVNVVGDNVLPLLGDFSGALEENEGNALGAIAGMAGLGGAVAGFETAKGTFDSVKEGVMGVKDGFMSVKDTAQQAWSTASNAGSWISTQASAAKSFVSTTASAVSNAASTSAAWISSQARAGAGWIAMQARAVGAFIATSASAIGQAAVTSGAWLAAQGRAAAGWAVTAAAATGSFLVMSGQAIAQAAATSAAWVASNARTAASFLVTRGAMVATTVATGAMTAAQWLLNVALNANPIALVIIAITALVGGLVWFFTQTELGRQIVTAAWDGILAGWNWMYDKVSSGIAMLGEFFGFIGEKATEAKDWVVGAFGDLVGFVTGLPAKISTAAGGMWDGIQNAFKGAINWIIRAWNSLEFKIPGFSVGPVKWSGFTLGLPDLPQFRAGGIAHGPGNGTSDSIIARISNGEYITPEARVTPETLPVLNAIRGGWVPDAAYLHAMLPGFAEGGLVTADQLNRFPRENGLEGAEYDWGGVNWGDCSGAMSALANFATGREPFGSRFATGNQADELAARGFQPGLGPAGSFNLGWYNGGPYGGHTAGTLPDGTNVEMGGARGDGQVGGGAASAADSMFTDHAHLPPEFFLGGDPSMSGGGAAGGSAGMSSGSVGGGSASMSGGGGGATGIGGSFSGGSAGEVKIAGGDAQPVWVTNWPSSAGSFAAPVDPMATADAGAEAHYTPIEDTMAAAESPPLGGTGVDEQYQAPTAEDVGAIGTNFAKANTDQFLSDLGLPTGEPGGMLGGLMQALQAGIKIVEEHVHYHVADVNDAMRQERDRRRTDALAFNTVRR